MDKAFVKKALEGSMAEVEMGKLALQKSSDDQVKQFAQRMVDDHSKMVDQLKPVAEQMGVKVPDGPSKGADEEHGQDARLCRAMPSTRRTSRTW